MTLRTIILVAFPVVALLAAALWTLAPRPRLPDAAAISAAYAAPLPPPDHPLAVYHLGHSLVGRDMPAMLAQLAGPGYRYDLQLGWGTSLKEHWEPDLPINGFAEENDTPHFRPAREAIGSGDYDAVILTEMVELRDAIRYHDSPRYFRKWADLARAASPSTRVYLYETWHPLDTAEGWLDRLDRDLPELWERKLLLPDLDDLTNDTSHRPAHVIPAGQVMAAFVRRLEDEGGIGNIRQREDLFALRPDGTPDPIHPSDLGNYLVALTHYAVLYGQSPLGLPHALTRADGTPATAPDAEAARAMQDTVWQIVTTYPKTGVAQ
ncbi:hypothetical protein [Pseudodonghicola xiamenensis]|uniref:Uncharacterized protein n=1 Tax=Pseudodonghicola xiamenensis TaxID=337702 RepID=A0A8J3H9G6_9RHOB|nr:hypothetical protein [Pseudodonghicola xiamenensis]GHG93633.1 hypothetical protein GCM10010961_26240 [Pseudodonghicola xiamenensis]